LWNEKLFQSVPNNDAFFNENFTVQRFEPEVAASVLPPDQSDSSDVIVRYRDTKYQASTADKAINVMPASSMPPTEVVRFRDVATTTAPYENYPQEPLEPPGHISGRPSSYREPTLQPIPAVRRNISDRIASLSMTALNDGPNVREPTSKGVMFRPSNINAVPTAFVQQPFMAADYGKMLVCIHNFHGQTANQLSLKAGEKVILIKCGSKGWVFTKHVESQRTGWFPSRYVQILPDSPVTTQL
uniref:SH3 domain-containing protein n=1 Tax=Toxocara canis TaxID=6265 RepID=A0A183USU7_TOXCA